MMKKLLHHLSPSAHMISKIWLYTLLSMLAVVMALAFLMNLVVQRSWLAQELEQTQGTTAVTAMAFDDSYDQTIRRFVEICATDDFQKLFPQLAAAEQADQTNLNNSVQSVLNALINQNTLVSAAILMNRSDICFHPFSRAIYPDTLSFTLGYEAGDFTGITLLPRQKSPVRNVKDVIPMALPLSRLHGTPMITVADTLDEAELMLYLFLDADAVNTLLRTYAAQGVMGTLYLAGSNGRIINYRADDELSQRAGQVALTDTLERHRMAGEFAGSEQLQGYYAVWYQEADSPFALVNLVPRAELANRVNRFAAQLPSILLGGVLAITLATFITSLTITKPLRRLMNATQAMERGDYDSGMVLAQHDELGQLSAAMDSMYTTIEHQIDEIRQERQAKDNAEIRLISEQINPHFLYNTLEAINMEVYSRHAENASAMIQNLGEFLRIGLSFGSRMISVRRELEHVQAYVNIMNHRFNHRIIFSSAVDESCLERDVLKIILQPLVENSIRHGFHLDSDAASLEDQFISVEVHETEDGGMTLAVIDNGVGIDLAKAERMLHTDPAKQRHVGLNNVYQRLQLQYGPEARITFDSIPYFRNTVCIHLPAIRQPDNKA